MSRREITAVDGIDAARTIRPGAVDELRDVVRDIAGRGEAAVVVGLGAHLDIGAPPRRLDVIVGVDRLARIVDHEAADMTVTVEAGCPLDRLAATLAEANQWLPLDPPCFADTTIGGLIATNGAGPLRASQGTVRDLLLGLRVVDAEGRLVSGGGKVVKNVAGYDLPKLHVGALGTLGAIVEATFKVRPRPEREGALVLRMRTIDDAAALALAVRDVVDPFWLEAGTLDDGVGVAVGLGGLAADVLAARRAIEDVATRGAIGVEWVEDAAALRTALGRFVVEPAAAVLRASVLPADLPWVLARAQAVAGRVPMLAHVANGIVRVRLDDPSRVAGVVSALRPEVGARGGFLVVERASPPVKRTVDVWGDPGEGLGLMRRVKATYDPHGVFAPGRYVGGL